MLRTVSGIGTVRAKSAFAKEKNRPPSSAKQVVAREHQPAYSESEGKGFEPLPSILLCGGDGVCLKDRVWQRRLLVPVESCMRKMHPIGR